MFSICHSLRGLNFAMNFCHDQGNDNFKVLFYERKPIELSACIATWKFSRWDQRWSGKPACKLHRVSSRWDRSEGRKAQTNIPTAVPETSQQDLMTNVSAWKNNISWWLVHKYAADKMRLLVDSVAFSVHDATCSIVIMVSNLSRDREYFTHGTWKREPRRL